MSNEKKLSVAEFSAKIKAKYPQYADVDDSTLTAKIIEKYPQYESQVDFSIKKKEPTTADLEQAGELSGESGQEAEPTRVVGVSTTGEELYDQMATQQKKVDVAKKLQEKVDKEEAAEIESFLTTKYNTDEPAEQNVVSSKNYTTNETLDYYESQISQLNSQIEELPPTRTISRGTGMSMSESDVARARERYDLIKQREEVEAKKKQFENDNMDIIAYETGRRYYVEGEEMTYNQVMHYLGTNEYTDLADEGKAPEILIIKDEEVQALIDMQKEAGDKSSWGRSFRGAGAAFVQPMRALKQYEAQVASLFMDAKELSEYEQGKAVYGRGVGHIAKKAYDDAAAQGGSEEEIMDNYLKNYNEGLKGIEDKVRGVQFYKTEDAIDRLATGDIDVSGFVSDIGHITLESLPYTLMAFNPVTASGIYMGIQNDAYYRYLDAGLSKEEAAAASNLNAFTQYGMERVGAKALGNTLKTANKSVSRAKYKLGLSEADVVELRKGIANAWKKEVPSEYVEEFSGAVIDNWAETGKIDLEQANRQGAIGAASGGMTTAGATSPATLALATKGIKKWNDTRVMEDKLSNAMFDMQKIENKEDKEILRNEVKGFAEELVDEMNENEFIQAKATEAESEQLLSMAKQEAKIEDAKNAKGLSKETKELLDARQKKIEVEREAMLKEIEGRKVFRTSGKKLRVKPNQVIHAKFKDKESVPEELSEVPKVEQRENADGSVTIVMKGSDLADAGLANKSKNYDKIVRSQKSKASRDLKKELHETFGLTGKKNKATRAVFDAAIGTMAEREGITKDEMMDKIILEKGDADKEAELRKQAALFQIGTEKSNLTPEFKERVLLAEKMEKEGRSAGEIWDATGMEREIGGKWSFDITPIDVPMDRLKNQKINKSYKLSELLGDKQEVFKFYPSLKDLNVMVSDDFDSDRSFGSFDPKTNTVSLNVNRLDYSYGTLVHEIQHAIQQIDGLDSGANSSNPFPSIDDGELGRVAREMIFRRQSLIAGREKAIDKLNKILQSEEFIEISKEIDGMSDSEKAENISKADSKYREMWIKIRQANDGATRLMDLDDFISKGVSLKDMVEVAIDNIEYSLRVVHDSDLSFLQDRLERIKENPKSEEAKRSLRMAMDIVAWGEEDGDFDERKEYYLRNAGEVQARNAASRALSSRAIVRENRISSTETMRSPFGNEKFLPRSRQIRGKVGAGTVNESKPLFQNGSLVWESTAIKGATQLSNNPRTTEQWMKGITEKGGKGTAQELHWIGLKDFLESWSRENGKKSIPKDVVVQYINDNQIEIEDVYMGGKREVKEKEHIDSIKRERERYWDKEDENSYKIRELRIQKARAMDALAGGQVVSNDDIYEINRRIAELKDEQEKLNEKINKLDKELYETYPPTRYSDYTLDGGENYREVLLTLPKKASGSNSNFKSSHWDESNILAHVRMNDRTLPNGEKVLFIEEIQSDWAQEGKKRGFGNRQGKIYDIALGIYQGQKQGRQDLLDRMKEKAKKDNVSQKEIEEALIKYGDFTVSRPRGVPQMPYKKTDQWAGMAFRRIFQMAAQEGYDRVAWVTGEQSADRYDLNKQVDKISAIKDIESGKYSLYGSKNNTTVFSQYDVEESKLESILGKELASKIIEENERDPHTSKLDWEGEDLSVGGEGMKAFYNRIIPNIAKNEARRFDKKAKIDVVDFKQGEIGANKQLSIPISKDMRMNLNSAVPLFQGAKGAMVAADNMYIIYALTNPNVSTPLHELAHVYEHYLTDKERAEILKWAGHEVWTTETSEFFARGFEKYLADGKAPIKSLQKIFDNFKKWLTDIYNGITGSEIDIELSSQAKVIYDNMLTGEENPIMSPEEEMLAKEAKKKWEANKIAAKDVWDVAKKKLKRSLNWANKMLFKRDADLRRVLSKNDMGAVIDRLVASLGSGGKAKAIFDDIYKDIWEGMNSKDTEMLDEIITFSRIIAIDDNRKERGLKPIKNFQGTTVAQARARLKDLRVNHKSKYDKLKPKADRYFDVYREYLTKAKDNGLVSEKVYNEMIEINYRPTKFLQHLLDPNNEERITTERLGNEFGQYSQSILKAIKEGSDKKIIADSEFLLKSYINSIEKRLFRNEAALRLSEELEKLEGKDKEVAKDIKFLERDIDKLSKKKDKSKEDIKELKEMRDELKQKKGEAEALSELNDAFKVPKKIGYNKNGSVKYASMNTKGYSPMYYFKDGARHKIYVKDGILPQWNDNQRRVPSEWRNLLSNVLLSRVLKWMATTKNPLFSLVNLVRDFGHIIHVTDVYDESSKIMGVPVVPKGMLQLGKDTINAWGHMKRKSKDYKDFIEYGGMMDYLHTQGNFNDKSSLRGVFRSIFPRQARDIVGKIDNAIFFANRYSEVGFRVAVFRRTLKNKMKEIDSTKYPDKESRDKAVEDAKYAAGRKAREIIDFAQGGRLSRDLESVVPYFNAATQATRVSIDYAIENPKHFVDKTAQSMLIMSGLIASLSLTIIQFAKPDEDDEDEYGDSKKHNAQIWYETMQGVSSWEKRAYVIIPLGYRDENGNLVYVKIPKTHQSRPAFIASDYFVEKIIYHWLDSEGIKVEEPSAEFAMYNTWESFNSDFLPFHSNPAKSTVDILSRSPVGGALLGYKTGYDFFRNEPVAYDLEDLPDAMEGYDSKNMPDFYKALADEFGVSPARSKYAFERVFTSPKNNIITAMLYSLASNLSNDEIPEELRSDIGIWKNFKGKWAGTTSPYPAIERRNFKFEDYFEDEQIESIKEGKKIRRFAAKFRREILKDNSGNEELGKKLNEFLEEFPDDQKKEVASYVIDYVYNRDLSPDQREIKYLKTDREKAAMMFITYGYMTREDLIEEYSRIHTDMNQKPRKPSATFLREYDEFAKRINKTNENNSSK